MNTILHRNIVLVLNRNWQAIDTTTPAGVFGQMATDAATGLDIRGRDWMVPATWFIRNTFAIPDWEVFLPRKSKPSGDKERNGPIPCHGSARFVVGIPRCGSPRHQPLQTT